MSVEAIGFATLAIGFASLLAGADAAMWAFIVLTLLGSAGAVLLGGSGTVQPAHLMLGFLVIAVLRDPARHGPIVRSMTFPREGFWLGAFVAYAVAGAQLLPRVFAGATAVNAVGSTEHGPSMLLVPLGPTSGNATQSIYLLADLACFVTTLAYASTARGFGRLAAALVAYSGANIVLAVLDVATAATGTGDLLGFIRNAAYQLHVEETTVGLRRIVGSFTETSAFSAATIGALAFTMRLWLGGQWPRITGPLGAGSLVLLMLSTSSTAYAATPLVLALLYAGAVARLVRGVATAQTLGFVVFAPLVGGLAVLTVLLTPAASDALQEFIGVTLLEKSSSQSGLERQQWNQTALRNFIDTYGLGGGLGSIRASSFPLAVLSNTGLVGAAAFAAFLWHVFCVRASVDRTSPRADVVMAARMACAGLLIAATASGALVDLGLPFFVFAALASATAPEQAAMEGAPRSTEPVPDAAKAGMRSR